MQNKIYARVENNQIVEYPVYLVHIRTRNANIEDFVEVTFNSKPSINNSQEYIIEEPQLQLDGSVVVDYIIKTYTSEEYNKLVNDKKDLKKKSFKKYSDKLLNDRPKILSSLGFNVDARFEDLQRLESLLSTNPNEPISFRDADNNFQNITVANLNTIINEIKNFHVQYMQWKWSIENLINSCTTIEDLENIDFGRPTGMV